MSKNTLEEMRKRLGTISTDAASEDEGVIRMRELLSSEDGGLFSGWLKKPEDFGKGSGVVDVGKAVLGTANDIGANVNNAILKATEALIDTTAYGVGAIGGIFSDDFKQGTKSFIAKDLFGTSATDEAGNPRETTGHIIQKLSPILTGDVLLPLLGGRIEENSVLNQKADSLVESAAHMVGSQALERFVGVPSWLTMGVNSFGGELQEAFGSDAEYGEAGASALISAVAEGATEKLGGAKFFGGKTASDAVTKFLTKKMGKNIGKYLAKLGIDASMEGVEEVVSGLVSSVGKKMTYMDDKEFSEIFSSQDAFDAFFSGALLGAAGSGVDVAQSKAAGVDPVSKMTVNEEAVVEAVYKDRLSKADKKLTAAEKTKLYDSVIRDMERGQITTGEIEAVLGGDSYKAYQEASAEEKAVLDKLESLYKGDELAQKRQKILQDSKLGQLQTNLSNEVYAKVANDRLAESYREVTRKNEAFAADLNNYPEAQRATVQRAIESGVLNNTNSAHTLVDLVAKLEADKGTTYDFTNNEKLLESGFAIQDATVNGYVKDGKITINVNAAKALDSVIGHEITHVLEGSGLYSSLQKAVTAYAKRKGEYDSRMKGIVSLYENVKGYQGAEGFSAMEKELVADLVGDYLFTDTDFVKHLSSADRNLFQRIYDEIKYLCKVVTAGSQEARDLEKVKRLFEQTYRDAEVDAERISSFEGDVRYSLAKNEDIRYSLSEIENAYQYAVENGDMLGAEMAVERAANLALPNSKIRDKDGNLIPVYHGTEEMFWKFDTTVKGGHNGTAEGFGIYTSDDPEVTSVYGQRQIKMFANITKPATSTKKTISPSLLTKLVKDTCKRQAQQMVADGEYDTVKDALMDTWVSNYVYTYDVGMEKAYRDVASSILRMNDNDMAVIQEVMTGMAIRDYATAMDFYHNSLTPITGFDGFVTQWTNGATGKQSNIYLAFDSSQLKSADAVTYDDNGNVIPLSQRFNPKNDDIRYSLSKVENDGFAPKSRGIYGEDVRFDGQDAEVKTQEDPEIDYEPVYRKNIRPTGKLINDIVDEVKKQLPVKRGKTNELRDLIRSYYSGSVDASKLYEEIKSKYGVYTETYVNEQIKDVKRELRSYRLQVSDKIKGDIPDYGDMVRRNRGRVIFANDGVPVDVAYDELNAAYPYFFPATVTNPTDQLLTMLNVANSTTTETQNTPVDDADIRAVVASIESAVTKYRDAKSLTEEQKAIARVDAALDVEKRLVADEMALEFQQLSEEVADKDTYVKGKAKEIYDELKSLKKGTRASDDLSVILDRGYDWRSVKTALLNIHDWPGEVVNENSTAEAKIRDIINQGYDEKVSELNQYNERYQERISKLEEEAEEKRQTASRAGRRKDKIEQYTAEAKDIAGDTTHWKDKKLGVSYMVNTLRRNLRDIVLKADGSRDIARADRIYEYLQGDFNRENATVNREATRIKKPYADSKITTAEDAYIQMLGELRHNPETTLTPEVVQEYYKKHSKKIDTAKVEKIISMARNTYDSLFEGINERLREQGMKEIEYRKGYFPHLPNEVGPVAKFFERVLNWKAINNEIPTSIAGMTETFTPHKTYQSFDKSRKSDRTEYSFTKGMDAYVRGALDWIHHLENYQRRRTFENYIRYIHSSEGVQKRIDEIMHSDQYDGDTVWEAVDAVYAEAKNPLHNFVQDLRRGTNAIMNKKSAIDRGTEAMINRSVYSVVSNLSSRVTANMVAGSLSSALTNFIPITQSWAVVSPRQSVIAMGETIRNTVYDDGTIEKSTFLTNRLREAENLYKTFWDKAGEKVTYLMKAIDSFTSQTVWRSKYNTNIESGMSEAEAIADADIFAENVIGGRSRGNMPTIFEAKNPVAKMFTAFQLEVANQYGYMLKDLPQDVGAKAKGNLIKGYGTMFVGAYVYNMLYSALTGRDSAFDPIGIIQGLLEDLDDNEEPEDYADTALQFAEDVVQEVPFIGGLLGGGRIPLSSAMPYGGIQEAFTNTVTDIANEDYKTLTAEWLTPLAYTLLPVGGGQAKKTIQGLQMFFPGEDRPVTGSYTDSGNLRFPVEATPWNVAQAALFGQWASPNAREYFDEQRMPLSPKQTQEYVDVGLPISDYWEYREGLSGLSTLSEKGDYINSLPLTTEQKNILINNVTDRKEPIDMTGADQYPSFEEFDFAMQNPKKYQFLQSIGVDYSTYNNATDSQRDAYNWAANNTTRYAISKTVTDDLVAYRAWTRAINSFEADKDEDGKPVSGSRKEKVEAYISSLPLGEPQKAILLKQAYSTENSDDEIIARYVAGLDLTTREKVEILEALGFTVKNGRVEW